MAKKKCLNFFLCSIDEAMEKTYIKKLGVKMNCYDFFKE